MIVGMFLRRPSRQRYARYRKTAPKSCVLCIPAERAATVEDLHYCIVVKARFSYDLWEFQNVVEHLMILPKRHIVSLSELEPHERLELFDTACRYEGDGYNLYARAPGSVRRTVPAHQHTHLIKTDNKKPRGGIYLEKPYLTIKL